MCRWLAYVGDPVFLETYATLPEHSLVAQSLRAKEAKIATHGDGFGIGWYGERSEPAVFREHFPAWSDENLAALCRHIRSRFFFAHVRASTGTGISRANCHPFSHGEWLFMHNGQIGGYHRLRRSLEGLIPDELYRARAGTTDSELLFLLMLSLGLREEPLAATARALAVVEQAMRSAKVRQPLRFTAALGDGERLYAFRAASDGRAPSLYYRVTAGNLLLVSEPLDGAREDWRELPCGQALIYNGNGSGDKDGRLEVSELPWAPEIGHPAARRQGDHEARSALAG